VTLQMQPEMIEAAITPNTTAIAIVHVLGGAVDIVAIREIADRHGLWLFEDTCESLGVLWDGKQVGSFGHLASFSFYFAHHITTIEGGMVVTDDDNLADLMRSMRAHGWTRHMESGPALAAAHPEIDSRFLFITTGFNLRPTDINGAIGSIQLRKLDGFNNRRREVARALDEGLEDLSRAGQLQPMRFHSRCTPAPFGYPVLCRSTEERNALQKHLETNGVETRPVICGNLARQPAMAHVEHRVPHPLVGADRVMDCGLYWGTHPMMEPAEIAHVLDQVRMFYR
jgi:CDP-6-deoxy-D-xylo-4-hexulose-3-dehydrase